MTPPGAASMAERMGFAPDARVLIINADDLGMHPDVDDGVFFALRKGLATSASLMVPAPSAAAAAARATPGDDIGVHLTVNSEWLHYSWSPLTDGASLSRSDGAFLQSCHDTLDVADPHEVRRELSAQLTQAKAWGIDVTHIDSHMYTLDCGTALFDVYVELALEWKLPVRLHGSSGDPGPLRARAQSAGVIAPDHLVALPAMGSREPLLAALEHLKPGVTEFHAHPARDTPAVRETFPDWPARTDDFALYCSSEDFRGAIERSGATLIGFRQLRDLARG